ncbi:hypothetical protein J2X68_007829 [Streptomyces sp. 3330]|nr:hypothetical protein [Streptomyces sp. 3330]
MPDRQASCEILFVLGTLRGQEFTRCLDDHIADRALSAHSLLSTAPKPGRRTPIADQLF